MSLQLRSLFIFSIRMLACLALLFCLCGVSLASTETTPAGEMAFPAINEVVPKATEVATGINGAEEIISQTAALEETYQKLTALVGKIASLEGQFTAWGDTLNWPLNRLMTAESRFSQLDRQQRILLDDLFKQLKTLDNLREEWTTEKRYWQDWQAALQASGVKTPDDIFAKVQQNIDELLKKISTASSILLRKQEEFSPGQEFLAERLNLISKTLDQLRSETFQRNAFSLLNFDFYRQFTPAFFAEYRANIVSTIRLPDAFWQRQGGVVTFQLILAAFLAFLLLRRGRLNKPVTTEWQFLLKHPLAGALFIALASTVALYDKIPPSWSWLLLTVGTIAGTTLMIAMLEDPGQQGLIRAVTAIYLISEALKVSGLPAPAYQLYQVFICLVVAPLCLTLARRSPPAKGGLSREYKTSLYLICILAAVALCTSLTGYAALSTRLVDAILGTFIVFFMTRMTIHLADGGITEFLRSKVIRKRQFIKSLGISTGDRVKMLSRIIIITNAALILPVVWDIYDDVNKVAAKLFGLEYTIGEFSISVHMVVTIAVVLYLTNLASWVVQALADSHYMSPQGMELGVKTALKRLLHYALFSVGFLIAISMAGLDLQKFTIIAGALGVGIGFGLQNIVNNFVSGLILLFERPVKVGDIINIDNQWGTITRIGLRSTVFETLDRAEIIVPNSELISEKVTNWTFTTNVSRIVIAVGVAYGSPLDKVLAILMRVANEHPEILKDPEPSALFMNFGESSLDFELRAWIGDINKRPKVKSELGQAIDSYFRAEGITIPFPQRDLHLRSIDPELHAALPARSQT